MISSINHMPFNYEKRLQQERLDEYYLNKKRIQEHHNKKIQLDKLMLEKYWEKIAMLQTYNRQKQLVQAQAEQGKFLDIEVK